MTPIRKITLPVALAACLCGISTAKDDAGNDAASARAVRVGEEFSFQITPLHDRDYFTMESPGNGTLRLELAAPLIQHQGIHAWWGEGKGENGGAFEIRSGNRDIRAVAGEKVTLAVRSSYYNFNEVANDEKIRARVVFEKEISPHEPNDTMDTAEGIKVGEEFVFQLNPRHDRDYFTMESPGNGTLRLELAAPLTQHREINPWWGEGKDENGGVFEIRPGNWDIRAAAGEKVTLAVRSSHFNINDVANNEKIRARVVFEEEISPHEPNDTMDTAEGIKVGEEFEFQINPRHDRDYFTMESPGNGTLRLELVAPLAQHREINPWWGEGKDENGGVFEIRPGNWDFRASAGEKVTLAVRSSHFNINEVANGEKIRARVVFEEEISPHEPNDTMATAEEIKVGEEFVFQLNPRHDRDYFTMESPGNGTLRLELVAPLAQHREINPWWGEGKDENGGVFEIRPGNWDFRASAGEKVTLAVRSSHFNINEVANGEKIRARVVFEEEISPHESNDTMATAEAVKVGEEFEFQINPRHDRDCFAVKAPADGVIAFVLIGGSKNIPLYPCWMEAEGTEGKEVEVRGGQWDRNAKAGETVFFSIRSSYFASNETASDDIHRGLFRFVQSEDGEPNDTPEQAREVPLDTPVKVVLNPRLDHDCLSFPAPGDGVIAVQRIDDGAVHPGLHPTWMASDSARGGVWQQRVKSGGRVVLQLRSSYFGSNETASQEPVVVQAGFIPEPDAPEAGEERDSAIGTDVGKTFRFALFPSWDQDWFRFVPDRNGFVKLAGRGEGSDRMLDAWWWDGEEGSREVQGDTMAVSAGKPVWLMLKNRDPNRLSADVLEATVEYSDGPPKPEDAVRRWTFPINRNK